MSANSPFLRGARLFAAIGLMASCANLIGLSEYEETDDEPGPQGGRNSDGGQGDGNAGGGGDGGTTDGEGGQAGAILPSGGTADGGQVNQPVGGEAGEEGPGPTGGRRGTGGERNTGGSPTGGAPGSGGNETGGTGEGGTPASGGSAGTTPTGGTPATGGNGSQGPTSCSLPGFSPECGTCIDQNCDAFCEPCLEDTQCAGLTSCLQDCVTETCLNGCFDDYTVGTGNQFLEVYSSCGFTTCQSTCASPFGAGCDVDADCTTDYCSGPGGFCSNLCDEDADCPDEGWCATDQDGINKCMLSCEDDFDCPTNHTCGYVSTFDDYAFLLCTSALTLAEPCDFNSECHSGICTAVSGLGYCTNPCIDDFSCAEETSCVQDSFGDPLCLVDCVDPLVCESYPDSECSTELDAEDNVVDVCWL